jgi:ABC-type ATPase involved in cell division
MQQLAEHDLIMSINDLTRGYPATPSLLFHNLNLAVYRKDFLVIHGRSGVGKSTLIKLLMRNLRPPKKKVYYKHEDISKFSDEEVQILRRKL